MNEIKSTGAENVFNQIRQQQNAKTPNKELGKDEFLKLLTYQMKAQNPLKPQDGQEFASQLAQFSQLEQLTSIKQLLADQSQASLLLSHTMANASAPSFIGKTAKALSSKAIFDGTNPIDIGYELNSNQNSVQVEIKNEAGALIRKYDLSGDQLKTGERSLRWDGKNENGDMIGTGKYSISIKATPATGGSPIDITPFISGKITSIKYKPNGSAAIINGTEVSLSDILDVSL